MREESLRVDMPHRIGLLPLPEDHNDLEQHFPIDNVPFSLWDPNADTSQYWSGFSELFDHDFLRWGALGLLFPRDEEETGRFQKYRWAFWHRSEECKDSLREFIGIITKSKTDDYLLLGHVAELRARLKSPHHDVLILAPGKIERTYCFSLASAAWG